MIKVHCSNNILLTLHYVIIIIACCDLTVNDGTEDKSEESQLDMSSSSEEDLDQDGGHQPLIIPGQESLDDLYKY